MLKKNEKLMMHIDDMTKSGEGVARHNGMTVFVDQGVVGDTVQGVITEVKKNYAKARLEKLERPSILRKSDGILCPYKDQCGGCAFFDVDYHEQLNIKQKQVKDALERIGGFQDPDILPIIGMGIPYHYRNKAQYKVSRNGIGFYKKGSHDVVPIQSCLTQPEISNHVIEIVDQIIKKYGITVYDEKTHKGLVRGVLQRTNREGKVMLIFVVNGDFLPDQEEIIKELQTLPEIVSIYLNINKNKGNRIMGDENVLLWGDASLTEYLGDKRFEISPGSFFQVNTAQTEMLYETVKEFANLKPGEEVYDLYCGTGTIGIYISEEDTKLTGIEISREAVQDAIRNAKINKMTNAQFLSGKAEVVTKDLEGNPDCIILDPPRKGCDASLIHLLQELKAPRIVYVSCNPASLARDLKELSYSYEIREVQPVDLFPMTGHVETVVLMSRKDT